MEVFQDITNLKFQISAETPERVLYDQSIDFCKWRMNPRINFFISAFEAMTKIYNQDLLKCPVKKGIYVFAETRLQMKEIERNRMPLFVPITGNITVKKTVYTKVGRIMEKVFNDSEVIQIY